MKKYAYRAIPHILGLLVLISLLTACPELIPRPKPYYERFPDSINAILIQGESLYLAGVYGNRATVWENGNLHIMESPDEPSSRVMSIFIKGSDVWTAGAVGNYPALWKNGIRQYDDDIHEYVNSARYSQIDPLFAKELSWHEGDFYWIQTYLDSEGLVMKNNEVLRNAEDNAYFAVRYLFHDGSRYLLQHHGYMKDEETFYLDLNDYLGEDYPRALEEGEYDSNINLKDFLFIDNELCLAGETDGRAFIIRGDSFSWLPVSIDNPLAMARTSISGMKSYNDTLYVYGDIDGRAVWWEDGVLRELTGGITSSVLALAIKDGEPIFAGCVNESDSSGTIRSYACYWENGLLKKTGPYSE